MFPSQAYYQWVPFVLFLQAGLFYAPHLLCKSWEGGKVRDDSDHSVSSFYVLHLISGGRDHLWAERHRAGQVGEVEQDAGAGPGEL